MSEDEFHRGVIKFCRLHKDLYPNTNVPALIREYALIEPETFPTPGEAWRSAINAVKWWAGGGYEEKPRFRFPIVGEALECIGWQEVGRADNVEATRAHFMRIYEQLVTRKKEQMLLGRAG